MARSSNQISRHALIRWLYVIIGTLALCAGVVGIFLPLLPTVPFLLLAAICYARSSERLYNWLLNHKVFGPPIRDWREHGAVSRRAKILATLSIAFAVALQVYLQVAWRILGVELVIFASVLTFIWTRPEG